jgi:hypothetical protein
MPKVRLCEHETYPDSTIEIADEFLQKHGPSLVTEITDQEWELVQRYLEIRDQYEKLIDKIQWRLHDQQQPDKAPNP